MSARNYYKATLEQSETKLTRVMERLGVEHYQSDWTSGKTGASCTVEMMYKGHAYRFENDTAKSAACGRNLTSVRDLFAALVLALECLARSVEQGIFTLDMLLDGKLALPEGKPLEPCFAALGFSARPETAYDVTARYRQLCKVVHPDAGGNEEDFVELNDNYRQCLELMESGT